MNAVYRFRIYPNEEQRVLFAKTYEAGLVKCRKTYYDVRSAEAHFGEY